MNEATARRDFASMMVEFIDTNEEWMMEMARIRHLYED